MLLMVVLAPKLCAPRKAKDTHLYSQEYLPCTASMVSILAFMNLTDK